MVDHADYARKTAGIFRLSKFPLGEFRMLWQNDGLLERGQCQKRREGSLSSFSSSRVSSFMLEEAKKRGATSASLSNLLHPKFTLRFLSPVAERSVETLRSDN